jgi:N-acyl-L-homoserine lactone synthetase
VIHIVTTTNAEGYSAEMLQAFELHQFDDEHAVHMLYIEAGAVLGYQRLCRRRALTS